MKKMTEYQRELVTEHIDLVECIIKRRIKVNGGILLLECLLSEDYSALPLDSVDSKVSC